MLPSGPSMPRDSAPLPSFRISDGRQVRVTPSSALKSKEGTAAQFWPKSITRFSPSASSMISPSRYSLSITTLPASPSREPSTVFQTYALTGVNARSCLWYISAPAVGTISPLNSVFTSGTDSFSGVMYPSSSRASYTSPS